ncbi:karyopherin [Dimargaris verticillata]|uniref:Karyopherin n=1 Tax=Dimargaris verticillata TaxID=2761393 RepID=A0A9W8EBY3_9FUNG|nr:karyopherin [Dimargaris verticillata]
MGHTLIALHQIIQALETIHAGAQVTPEQRKHAETYCEEARERPDAAVYGHHLAHQAQNFPDTVRHFGLSLIEHTVRYRWDEAEYTDAHRDEIQQLVIELAMHGLRDPTLLPEPMFIKEKVSQLVTEVAERRWPKQWPDFHSQLSAMYHASPVTQEISLIVLRDLADDLCVYEGPIAMLRKASLSNALMCVLLSAEGFQNAYPKGIQYYGQPLPLALGLPVDHGYRGWLVTWATTLREHCHSLRTIDPSAAAPSTAVLLTRHFEALRANIDMAPLAGLREMQWPTLILDYLELANYPQLRTQATELWLVFSRRHFADYLDRHAFVQPWLHPEVLSRWAQVCQRYQAAGSASNIDDDSPDARALYRLAQGTAEIGIHHICHKSNQTGVPDGFAFYVRQVLFPMSQSCNALVVAQVLPFWVAAYKHELIGPAVAQLVPAPTMLGALLDAVLQCSRVLQAYHADPNRDPLPEFESVAAVRNYFITSRLRALEAMQSVARLASETALPWLYSQMSQVLTTNAAQNQDSLALVHLETALLVCETVASIPTAFSTDQQPIASPALVTVQAQLCKLVLQLGPLDPTTIMRQLHTLGSFGPALARSEAQLFAFLDKVFGLMLQATNPHSTDHATLSASTGSHRETPWSQVQRRCATTLARLAQVIPDTFLQCYAQVHDAANRVVQSEQVPTTTKAYIYDFLLTVCFDSTAPTPDKLRVASSIVDPFVKQWQEFLPAVATMDAFHDFVGITYLDRAFTAPYHDSEYQVVRVRRAQLLLCLHVFLVMARRTKESALATIWASYLPAVFPMLLAFIRQLHALWAPDSLVSVDARFQTLVQISDYERQIIVNPHHAPTFLAPSTQPTSVASPIANIRILRHWLATCRDVAYQLLGLLTAVGHTHELPQMATQFIQAVFGDVAAVANHHWKPLIQWVVLPATLYCPPRYYTTFLPTFLVPLFQHMHHKLENEWAALVQRGMCLTTPEEQEQFNTGAIDSEDVSDEILAEKLLRDATKAWAEYVTRILSQQSVSTASATTYLLSHGEIASILISELSFLLRVKDSACSRLAIQTATRMVPSWAAVGAHEASAPLLSQLQEPVAHDLLLALFSTMGDAYHADNLDALVGLVALIYTAFRPHTTLPQQALAKLPKVTPEAIYDFEQRLVAAKSQKAKKAVCKVWTQGIVGVAKSQWFQRRVAQSSATTTACHGSTGPASPFTQHSVAGGGPMVTAASSTEHGTHAVSLFDDDPDFSLGDIMP